MRLVDLMPLNEIDFPNQRAFDDYNRIHKLRPDTKVSVAGRVTTAGRAAQNSKPVKGTSIFSKDAEKNAQSALANDKESPFKVTYVDDKGNTQIANTFKSKDDADNYASHFSPSSQVKVVSADDNKSAEAPQKLVFPDAKKKDASSEEPFEGGVDVIDTVSNLLPPGTGFTHKKTGNEILVKGYKDKHMLVSYEKYPNKILKWPLKQFFKLVANKELQFNPKPKETDTPVGSLRNRLQKNNPSDVAKFDEYLSKTIKDISSLTNNNDHNGAVMALAKMMDDKSSAAEIQKIQKYHQLKGHMPQSLTKYRSSILNNLLTQAKMKYGNKIAKQLNNAF
jgi:hypothetical protein